MAESGQKCGCCVSLHVEEDEDSERPCNADYRISRLLAWSQPKLVNELFPILRRLSEGVEENSEPKCYPLIVPMQINEWELKIVITVLLAHNRPEDEVAEALRGFLLSFVGTAVRALQPLPPAVNWPPGISPKRAVAFLRSDHWLLPRLV